jgi:hypothetical protein
MPLIISVPFFNNSIIPKRVKTANRRHLISNTKNILTANIKDFKYSDIIAILKFSFNALKESKVIKVYKKAKALR